MSTPLVFLSYAHLDQPWKEQVLPFLKQLELDGHLALWHDREIGAGEDWYGQIADALDRAHVAILLITQNFLASKFCKHEEVPVLLQRARAGRLTVLPLLAESCNWQFESWLKRLQIRPGDAKPLAGLKGERRREALAAFAREVFAATKPDYSPPQDARRAWPSEKYDLGRLPDNFDPLFGRTKELRDLDSAWTKTAPDARNVVVLRAGAGVGKSTLVRVWADLLAEDRWRGAERAFGWSFHGPRSSRSTSSERFVDTALRWFGVDPQSLRSHWDRAESLAECIRRQRTLLVLDAIEPLQSTAPADRGRIKDAALRVLVELLAEENPGLCILTTRERVADLDAEALRSKAAHVELEQVSKEAGRALLRVEGIKGDDESLERAVEEQLGGHALAVRLFATYASESAGHHVDAYQLLPALGDSGESPPQRVMDAWAKRLGESSELQLLRIAGLFDRPAPRAALDAIVADPRVAGLNDRLRAADLESALARLRASRLLAPARTDSPDLIDAHPLVRSHFGSLLKETSPDAWIEGNRRLYDHYRALAPEFPASLDEMEPLFAAVAHGCAARRHGEVGKKILYERILRRDQYVLTRRLGAYHAYLSCLTPFFERPWSEPVNALDVDFQTWLFNGVGISLQALGRPKEALELFESVLARRLEQGNWVNSAIAASNCCRILLSFGQLEAAEQRAREAVAHADKSDSKLEQIGERCRLADVLYNRGDVTGALELFADAEARQSKCRPQSPLLWLVAGHWYSRFLLETGHVQDVVARNTKTLQWAIADGHLVGSALDHLTLGQAYVTLGDESSAREHFEAAIDGLRSAGETDHLIRGLLARAAFQRTLADFGAARRSLEEAGKLIRRSGFRLFEADRAIEEARLALAEGKRTEALRARDEGRALVKEMGYGRRVRDVEELSRLLA